MDRTPSALQPADARAARRVSVAPAHNLLALDADGVARRCIPFVRVGDTTIPALAVEGAIEALGLAHVRRAIRAAMDSGLAIA